MAALVRPDHVPQGAPAFVGNAAQIEEEAGAGASCRDRACGGSGNPSLFPALLSLAPPPPQLSLPVRPGPGRAESLGVQRTLPDKAAPRGPGKGLHSGRLLNLCLEAMKKRPHGDARPGGSWENPS